MTKPAGAGHLIKYDCSDAIRNDQRDLVFLNTSVETAKDNPVLVLVALGDVARSRDMNQVAYEMGLTRERITNLLFKQTNPSFATVSKIAHAMGFCLRFQAAIQ